MVKPVNSYFIRAFSFPFVTSIKSNQPDRNFCTSITFGENDQASHFSADLRRLCVVVPLRLRRSDNHAMHIQVVIMRVAVMAIYD